MNNELFTGYARLTFTRKLDADGNPTTVWKFQGVGRPCSNSGLGNPYLYMAPGRAAGKGGKTYTKQPLYDDSNMPKLISRPYRNLGKLYTEEELKEYNTQMESYKQYKEWHANRPLIGYNETVHVAVEAKAIIAQGTFDDIVNNL